ncbi:MAG: ATP-binding cassette domain-containing protein [Candidatus Thalassarchaeaceae archaeon]|jgi:ABC-type phosphate/phosphonate transport system ATPase subunit|tara:strand:+ start:59 stop:763 length:705 start_codon:yes stop_codon:yes gene_type:complete
MDSNVVNIEGLTIGYSNKNPLVEIPRLEITSGEIIAITGPSGVGKTTLIRTISGLVRPLKGRVSLFGQPFGVRPKRGSLGYIPQRLGLVRHASVLHNVMLGARAGNSNPYSIFPNGKIRDLCLDSISRMGLSEKIYEPVRRLSGGQQRRVAIARTLAQSPKIILADEFLSELDEKTLEMVKTEVVEFVRKESSTLIVVEHDVSRAKSIADRMLVIDDGRVNPFISKTTALEVKK